MSRAYNYYLSCEKLRETLKNRGWEIVYEGHVGGRAPLIVKNEDGSKEAALKVTRHQDGSEASYKIIDIK